MDELRARLAEVSDLGRTSALLAWDQEVCMPKTGSEGRAELRATVGRLAHVRFVDDRVGELLADAQPRDALEADLVRLARRDFEKARRVPADLVAEMTRAAASGHTAWIAAHAASDFAAFAPHLERNVELRRRYSACFPEAAHVYDPLLDDFEPGMTTAGVRAAFEGLRDGLVELVSHAPEVDDALVRRAFPEDGQRRLNATVLRAVGAREEDGWRLDLAVHPFAMSLAPGDVRLTTRYEREGIDSLFSSLHEFGHGLYEAQVDPALARTPLGNGASSAWHESQSRLWENMIGRSPGFWRWCLPLVREAFPGPFDDARWEDVVRAVNAVRPTLIRVSADEVTYGLHVVLRFELELALLSGELEVADLPEAWNERTREYLGVEVPDDARGVLQDVHWAEGLFGYFPTYALGNVIAGQLWERIGAELPDLSEQVAAGDFAPLRAWLADNVHRHGRRLLPAELLELAVGGPLDPSALLRYLRGKLDASAALTP
jgi:carboxypeptidase Taq